MKNSDLILTVPVQGSLRDGRRNDLKHDDLIGQSAYSKIMTCVHLFKQVELLDDNEKARAQYNLRFIEIPPRIHPRIEGTNSR